MTLLIHQIQGSINGTFTPGAELLGNGSFKGTVDANGAIQFTVSSAQVSKTLFFQGSVQSDGSLSGTYCSVDEQNQCDANAGRWIWNILKYMNIAASLYTPLQWERSRQWMVCPSEVDSVVLEGFVPVADKKYRNKQVLSPQHGKELLPW